MFKYKILQILFHKHITWIAIEVLITKVVDGGAALKYGIKDLDVILSIDNIEVNSVNALQEKICQYDSGNKINCLIKRNKKEMQIEVILR